MLKRATFIGTLGLTFSIAGNKTFDLFKEGHSYWVNGIYVGSGIINWRDLKSAIETSFSDIILEQNFTEALYM